MTVPEEYVKWHYLNSTGEELNASMTFKESLMDSLDIIELVIMMEKEFAIIFQKEEEANLFTFQDLINLTEQKLSR